MRKPYNRLDSAPGTMAHPKRQQVFLLPRRLHWVCTIGSFCFLLQNTASLLPVRLHTRTSSHHFLMGAEEPPNPTPPRERANLRGRLPIMSRTVPLGIPNFDCDGEELAVTIWEVETPSELIEMWWSSGSADKEKIGDPFGVVFWPGSILAAREMFRRRDEIEGKTVLVLGAGTGLEAQAAAMLGAGRVIATDINKLTLKLLDFGAERAGLASIVESRELDLFAEQELPYADVVLAADILYNEDLGRQVGRRCLELLNRKDPGCRLIVTDSQRFHGTDFLPILNEERARTGDPSLHWEEHTLGVTTSGILVEDDQTYNVTARMLSVGWDVADET